MLFKKKSIQEAFILDHPHLWASRAKERMITVIYFANFEENLLETKISQFKENVNHHACSLPLVKLLPILVIWNSPIFATLNFHPPYSHHEAFYIAYFGNCQQFFDILIFSVFWGIFFTECGMFHSATIVLSCVQLFQRNDDRDILKIAMEFWTR